MQNQYPSRCMYVCPDPRSSLLLLLAVVSSAAPVNHPPPWLDLAGFWATETEKKKTTNRRCTQTQYSCK